MTVTDIDLIERLRDYALGHDIEVVTQDPTASEYFDVTGDTKDIYQTKVTYGGQYVLGVKSTLYETIWDLDLLAVGETFEVGVIENGADFVFRSSSLKPIHRR